jgi:hypothetical protein
LGEDKENHMTVTDKIVKASRRINNQVDNCLLCPSADTTRNLVATEIASFIRWFWNGKSEFADEVEHAFPVVNCKRKDGKYIANPLARPGWCPRDK